MTEDDRVVGADEVSVGGTETQAPAGGRVVPEDLVDLVRPGFLGPVLLTVIAVFLAGFIAGRATGPEAEAAVGGPSGAPVVRFPTGDEERVGYWGFGGVTPAAHDDFERPDDAASLGATADGTSWDAVSGTWGVEEGRAVVAPGPGPAIVVIDGGAPDRLTEATLMVLERGAGVAFGVQDAANHWSLTAEPVQGRWVLTRVTAGRAEVVGEVEGAVAAGTTVTVVQRGDLIRVLIDGREAGRFTEPGSGGTGASGLIASAQRAGTARWDQFYIGDLPPA